MLPKNREFLVFAVENSPATIMITDKNSKIIYVNKKFFTLTGYSPEEVIGKNPGFLNSGVTPKETYEDMKTNLSQNKEWEGFFVNRKKSGELYWERALISTLNDDGEIYYIAIKEDITEKKMLEEKIYKMNIELMRVAETDYLTGLYNRRFFMDTLEKEIQYSRRYSTPLCLMMIDVDFFKKVNDRYGHVVGDTVLKQISAMILETIRSSDIGSRYGGEEFGIILKNSDIEEAAMIGERLRNKVEAYNFEANETRFNATISIGISVFSENDGAIQLIEKADTNLYEAKKTGRNKVVYK